MRGRRLSLEGQQFGRLRVLQRAPNDGKRTQWRCSCWCGRETVTRGSRLVSGNARSCGICSTRSWPTTIARSELITWQSMLQRCSNKNDKNYGGRGIKVCARWRKSFEQFLADMGPRPSPAHTLDRKDNDGNYEPANCRWATKKQQARNMRRTVWVVYDGERVALADLAEWSGLATKTVQKRLARGYVLEIALRTPSRQSRAASPQTERVRRAKAVEVLRGGASG